MRSDLPKEGSNTLASGIRTLTASVAKPSSTDKRALRLLSAEMGEDARPAVMFIVAQKEIRTYIEESPALTEPEDPS